MTIALTEHELQFALRHLDQLNPAQKTQVLQLLEERERLAKMENARKRFLPFVKLMWPEFIPGAHHEIMAEAFERIASGEEVSHADHLFHQRWPGSSQAKAYFKFNGITPPAPERGVSHG